MTLAKAKLALSITFIVLASFTIITYDRQNMFIIQTTGLPAVLSCLPCHPAFLVLVDLLANLIAFDQSAFLRYLSD
jgi:hypothetical protein